MNRYVYTAMHKMIGSVNSLLSKSILHLYLDRDLTEGKVYIQCRPNNRYKVFSRIEVPNL